MRLRMILTGAVVPAFTLLCGCLSVNVQGSLDTDKGSSRGAVRVSHADGREFARVATLMRAEVSR